MKLHHDGLAGDGQSLTTRDACICSTVLTVALKCFLHLYHCSGARAVCSHLALLHTYMCVFVLENVHSSTLASRRSSFCATYACMLAGMSSQPRLRRCSRNFHAHILGSWERCSRQLLVCPPSAAKCGAAQAALPSKCEGVTTCGCALHPQRSTHTVGLNDFWPCKMHLCSAHTKCIPIGLQAGMVDSMHTNLGVRLPNPMQAHKHAYMDYFGCASV